MWGYLTKVFSPSTYLEVFFEVEDIRSDRAHPPSACPGLLPPFWGLMWESTLCRMGIIPQKLGSYCADWYCISWGCFIHTGLGLKNKKQTHIKPLFVSIVRTEPEQWFSIFCILSASKGDKRGTLQFWGGRWPPHLHSRCQCHDSRGR